MIAQAFDSGRHVYESCPESYFPPPLARNFDSINAGTSLLSLRHSISVRMERGQSSGAKEEGDAHASWAKLVPTDSRSPEIESEPGDAVICSEISSSSTEKSERCKITWNSEEDSALIRNISSKAIIVDGNVVGEEETQKIRSGSDIILYDKEGCFAYTSEVTPTRRHDKKSLKISLDVEHAKCSICLNIWHDVVTVAPCFHNFCNGCLSEWLRRSSSRARDKREIVVCPQCRAAVHSVGRNHFLHNIEEAILQTFSSLKRSDEEIKLLDEYASVKPNLILPMQKNQSRKRPLLFSSDGSMTEELPCPQCGTELGGFKCCRTTTHLQCQGCGGAMPSRPDIGVPQHCSGCDRAFCGAYWFAQGVELSEFNISCSRETFRPISERTIYRIPETTHQNNRYEKDITERAIRQAGKTLPAVISKWMLKFNNREIDRSRLQINHAETITPQTHLCNECYDKLVGYLLYWFRVSMPKSLLPPDASGREDCWYGYSCRTQHHSDEHAQKRNHVCRPTRGNPSS